MSEVEVRLRAENEELRERVRQLTDALRPDDVRVDPAWRLTRMEVLMFRHLVSRPVATRDSLELAMFSDRPGEFVNPKTIDIYLHRVRGKLAPHGISIRNRRGQGWSLDGRERFRACEGRSGDA